MTTGNTGSAVLENGRWVMTRNAISLGAIKGSLQCPQQSGGFWGVAVTPVNGSVFVSDYDNSQIHVFDVDRKHVRTFSGHEVKGQSSSNSQLHGIDVRANGDGDDVVFVVHNHLAKQRVNVFQKDGTFIRTIGQGKLQFPNDVLVHSSGLVYVTDCGGVNVQGGSNHSIAVFSQEGELVCTFGSWGEGEGKFKYPRGVAVSPDDQHLYVSDRNNRVQVFTLEGRYVREFGTGQLKHPYGLTVTSDGSVLVADRDNNRVAVFDKNGNLVHLIAVEDPTGLAIDSRGDLLVTSDKNKCVYYI